MASKIRKVVLAMAQGERGESRNIIRADSGYAIVGASKRGWAAIPSFLYARDAASFRGYEFGISAFGNLCYMRMYTRKAVTMEPSDDTTMHFTGKKASGANFGPSPPRKTPLDVRLSLLQLPDRFELDSVMERQEKTGSGSARK